MASMCPKIKLFFFLLLSTLSHALVDFDSQVPIQFEALGTSNVSTNCQQACASLQDYPGPAAFQPDRAEMSQYFVIQQKELLPQCVVQPETPEQVSQIIGVLKDLDCNFAIKSGGHSLASGASNINDGVLVDLIKMNSIILSEDESMVSLGPGAKWGKVYSKLEERGLITVGGRVGSVGVGGLTLGGGINFLSSQYGLACDNVRNFELVLANGSIIEVNQNTYPDLFFALRGGGNNFGIVTRFDFETHRHGPLWGGTTAFNVLDLDEMMKRLDISIPVNWSSSWSVINYLVDFLRRGLCFLGLGAKSRDLIEAFVNLANKETSDTLTHSYIFFLWSPVMRSFLSGTQLAYNKPESSPAAFKEMLSLKKFFSTNRIANMSDLAIEIEEMNAKPQRQIWDTATFKLDADLISALWDMFFVEIAHLSNIPGTLPCFNVQLFPKEMIAQFSKNGGNSLNIVEEDGPLFLWSPTVGYDNPEDDEMMAQLIERIIRKGEAIAKAMDLYHPYIYHNYAALGRDVFASYGKNRQRLLDIQQKYDPDKVFSRLQPGGFKL